MMNKNFNIWSITGWGYAVLIGTALIVPNKYLTYNLFTLHLIGFAILMTTSWIMAKLMEKKK